MEDMSLEVLADWQEFSWAGKKKGKKEANILAFKYGLKPTLGERGGRKKEKEAETEKQKTRLSINYSHIEWTRFLHPLALT